MKQAQAVKTDYQPITVNAAASTKDKLIRSDVNTGGENVYEILLVRKDHIIAKVVGPHKAGSVPVKLELPQVFPVQGHTVDAGVFKLYTKGQATEAKAKVKKAGPKREGPTKMSKCRDYVKANPNGTKADYMVAFQAPDIGCTKMGANTYYLTLKKEFNLP